MTRRLVFAFLLWRYVALSCARGIHELGYVGIATAFAFVVGNAALCCYLGFPAGIASGFTSAFLGTLWAHGTVLHHRVIKEGGE